MEEEPTNNGAISITEHMDIPEILNPVTTPDQPKKSLSGIVLPTPSSPKGGGDRATGQDVILRKHESEDMHGIKERRSSRKIKSQSLMETDI